MIYAGGALFLAAAGGVVLASCSRGWADDGAVPAVVTAEIAAGAAASAATAMRATIVTSPRVAGAAAQGASAADVLADCGKKRFQLKKHQRFRKHYRQEHRARARARMIITPQTYGTEEVQF